MAGGICRRAETKKDIITNSKRVGTDPASGKTTTGERKENQIEIGDFADRLRSRRKKKGKRRGRGKAKRNHQRKKRACQKGNRGGRQLRDAGDQKRGDEGWTLRNRKKKKNASKLLSHRRDAGKPERLRRRGGGGGSCREGVGDESRPVLNQKKQTERGDRPWKRKS